MLLRPFSGQVGEAGNAHASGSRPSITALTRSEARNANAIVMLTFRVLHPRGRCGQSTFQNVSSIDAFFNWDFDNGCLCRTAEDFCSWLREIGRNVEKKPRNAGLDLSRTLKGKVRPGNRETYRG